MELSDYIAKYKKESIISVVVTLVSTLLAIALFFSGFKVLGLLVCIIAALAFVSWRYSYDDYKNYRFFEALLEGRL